MTTTYTPTRRSLLRLALREMVGGLRKSPYSAYRMFRRDIKAQYAKSVLGLAWEFIDPIAIAAVFIFLYRFRALSLPDMEMP